MWMFWVCASALAAGAAGLIAWLAARRAGESGAGHEDGGSTAAVYRRQLAEVRELADRGLIRPDELRATEAEAGRRLLADDDKVKRPWSGGSPRARAIAMAAGVAGAAGALALYLLIGAHGAADQPFRARLAVWRQTDPARLTAEQMAAVLVSIARERPRDPAVHEYLGRAQLAAGDAAVAAQSFARAARLAPRSATLQAELGEALTLAGESKVTPEAEAAFNHALSLDPKNAPARYFLGRGRLAAGDASGALALWKGLDADLPPDDPRRPALRAEMARAEGKAAPPAAPGALDADTRALAQGMVARLAARLATAPDDLRGWARLVRAYGVLGDRAAQTAAVERARKQFAGRPDDLTTIEAAAR